MSETTLTPFCGQKQVLISYLIMLKKKRSVCIFKRCPKVLLQLQIHFKAPHCDQDSVVWFYSIKLIKMRKKIHFKNLDIEIKKKERKGIIMSSFRTTRCFQSRLIFTSITCKHFYSLRLIFSQNHIQKCKWSCTIRYFLQRVQVAKFIITMLNVWVLCFLIMFQLTFLLIYHKNEGSTNFCDRCYKQIYRERSSLWSTLPHG